MRPDAERGTSAWIEAHGSPRLRALVREGIEWERVYRRERLAVERPGWTWESLVCGAVTEPRGPSVTDEHLAALEEARAVEPAAQIRWLADGEHVRDCGCPDAQIDEEDPDDGIGPAVRQRMILWAPDYLGREIVREMQ